MPTTRLLSRVWRQEPRGAAGRCSSRIAARAARPFIIEVRGPVTAHIPLRGARASVRTELWQHTDWAVGLQPVLVNACLQCKRRCIASGHSVLRPARNQQATRGKLQSPYSTSPPPQPPPPAAPRATAGRRAPARSVRAAKGKRQSKGAALLLLLPLLGVTLSQRLFLGLEAC